MTEFDRKMLEKYMGNDLLFSMLFQRVLLSEDERQALIAAALRNEIVKRAEWYKFIIYAHDVWMNDDTLQMPSSCDAESWFTEWLTDPHTFIRLVVEWRRGKE
jgi:hypothetical protein